MTQREISLKKDETLLVKWIAEPFRYARLVRVPGDSGPRAYIFDIHPIIQEGGTELKRADLRFYHPNLYVSLYYGPSDDQRGGLKEIRRDSWGEQTVKQLLASALAGYLEGYEVVDWGGFAVSDDRPATQVY
ncbi:hypothetical protein [Nocardia altamirensis]|uniref:hypothetical protein n=1 Tax=Nocardia altamirensis TaxID=472158 RepID=UPI0008405D99|nr:hypothetical protein [Nocardia altamirensis]